MYLNKGVSHISLTERQKKIAEMVRRDGPITGEQIAHLLGLTRAALRSDLAILIMSGVLDARPRVGYFYTGKNTLGMLQEEISGICVRDIQSVPIVLGKEKSVYDAIVTMFLEDVGTVFLTGENGLLLGVVSRKDLLKVAMNRGENLHTIPLVMVMTPISKLITVQPEDSVAAAARKLIDNEVDCLPVVHMLNNKHQLEIVGRVTKTSFTRLFVELAEGKGGCYHN